MRADGGGIVALPQSWCNGRRFAEDGSLSRSAGVQDAGAEQVELGPAVAGSFQQLQPVDRALDILTAAQHQIRGRAGIVQRSAG